MVYFKNVGEAQLAENVKHAIKKVALTMTQTSGVASMCFIFFDAPNLCAN
jgi:hypothetical protein